MVSTRPLISKSSSAFIYPLVTAPTAQITTDIIITSMFHSFFNSLARSWYFIFLFTFFQFYSVVCRDSKVYNSASSIFLLSITRSGRLAEIRWFVCISKSVIFSFESFFTSISWWISIEVWETTSFLKSPRLFSVFWPTSTMLLFRWSPLVLLFPSPPVSLSVLGLLYRERQLQLVSPSLSSSLVFFCPLARSW